MRSTFIFISVRYLGSRAVLKVINNNQINRFRGSQNLVPEVRLAGVNGLGRVQVVKIGLPDEGVPRHVRPEVDLLVDDGGHLLVQLRVHGLRDRPKELIAENVVAVEPGASLKMRNQLKSLAIYWRR